MSGLNRLKTSTPQMSNSPSTSTSSSSMSMMPSPFQFPLMPFSFGFNPFDNSEDNRNKTPPIDPNRILHILHQQSLLAEELLKYRTLLGLSTNPFADNKPSIELFKIPSEAKKDVQADQISIPSNKRQIPSSSTSEIDLTKDECPAPKIKTRPDSELFPEKLTTTISAAAVSAMLIDPDELKCHICMANFPSLWLLEQHTALQHSQLSCSEKSPTKCDNCGQNYR